MSAWAQRKRLELSAKLAGVTVELERWRTLSAEKGPLERHHTQITRVTRNLDDLGAEVAAQLERVDAVESWQQLERAVLDLHALWGFFRDRFAQRQEETFERYLRAADAFAWECYEPARSRAVACDPAAAARVREPPLIGLGSVAATPFALPRGTSYAADVSGLTGSGAREVARCLPIPVVTVPWFALQHVPEVVVIGHEVGHHLEDDFALSSVISALVPDDAAWQRWCGEVFADVYATLAVGPAYAHVLCDFLSHGATDDGSGAYPPLEQRLGVVVAVLQGQGADAAAEQMVAEWAADGITVDLGPDVCGVASALVAGPYPAFSPDCRLDGVLTSKNAARATADASVNLLRRERPVTAREIRTVIAGAALAWHADPCAFGAADAGVRALDRIAEIDRPGTRGRLRREQHALVETADAERIPGLAMLLGRP